ncbi:MAG TPA: hypothetical protein VD970_18045 [Acetobacteraceae bacterium]|nr:hypothetical protein [Acetobacteraceae bacterium]
MSDDRTPCAVPFCRHSKKGRWAWWLCRDHYRLVPPGPRRRHARLKAYFKRRGAIEVRPKSWSTLTEEATRVMDAAARSIIRAATARATGL